MCNVRTHTKSLRAGVYYLLARASGPFYCLLVPINQIDRVAVFDYLYEHAVAFPSHAGSNNVLSDRVLRQALHAIPDEYHVAASSPIERFIGSVIAEAHARKADPYHVAEFALDLVPA